MCRFPTKPNIEVECKPADFCDNPDVFHRVDWDYYASLHNWVEDLDLACTPKAKIGLIGSMYFAGYTTSAILLPRFSDLFGRKLIYFISMVGHLLVYGVFLFSKSLTLTIVMMVFFGFFSLGRASVGYIYM